MEKRRRETKTDLAKRRLTDEAELLDRYLNQYKCCIGKKRSLEIRREEIIREFDFPLPAVKMDGMPRSSRSGEGCAAISFRLDEIETMIREQMGKAVKILSDIMDVIDLLPENSLERSIIENKYIDRYKWDRVCKENHISRTPATKSWRKGLYTLLESRKVQQILKEYRDGWEKA